MNENMGRMPTMGKKISRNDSIKPPNEMRIPDKITPIVKKLTSRLQKTPIFLVAISCVFCCLPNPSNAQHYRAAADTFSSNLPIIIIDTEGKIIRDEPRVVAHMGIVNNGANIRNSSTDPFTDYDGRINIEIRGNSSQSFPKKAYAFETQDAMGENNNVELLGLPEENDWILYAPYSDKTLMRNVITFELARRMGRYAPRTRFCELVINDDYKGVYVLMEKIKRDKNRVDIANLTENDISGDELTGGYILNLDWEDERSFAWESEIDGTQFHFHHPQKDDLLPVQREYIENWMHDFEAALDSDDYRDPQIGYRRFVNLGSFVDYFIGAEFARNVDSYRISTYMFKEKDSDGGLLNMGPQWDFNLAYGNQEEGNFDSPRRWVFSFGLDPINFWWDKFVADTVFTNAAKSRWAELRQTILSEDAVFSLIDSAAAIVDEAKDRNFERWPILGIYVWPNAFIGDTYEEEIGFLKGWISERVDWVDEEILKFGAPTGISSTTNDHVFEAFPNPFRNSTTIRYKIPALATIHLAIYNTLGQEVKSLVSGRQENGEYTVKWDGRNNQAEQLSSGIYFYRLQFNNQEWGVEKLIILR